MKTPPKSRRLPRLGPQGREAPQLDLFGAGAPLFDPDKRAGFVGHDSAGHFRHYCSCGAWGAYGYEAVGGKLGRWFCAEHRPVT
jgi:hypothetical protein